jgi:hypothetical protein
VLLLLLLGVDLFATIITRHSVLLHRRSERTATLRSSLRPHKTLIPGPNPHRGPKARRIISRWRIPGFGEFGRLRPRS